MNVDSLLKKYVFWPEIDNDFHKNVDFSKTPLKEISQQIASSISYKKIDLHDSVLKFYGYNEYFNHLRNKSDGFIDKKETTRFAEYQLFLDDFSKKIFAYILYCSVTEARHSRFFEDYNEFFRDESVKAYLKKIKSDKNSDDYKKLYDMYDSQYDKEDKKHYSFNQFLNDKYYDFYDLPRDFQKEFELHYDPTEFAKKLAKRYNDLGIGKDPDFVKFLKGMLTIVRDAEQADMNGEYGELQYHISKHKLLEQKILQDMSFDKFAECLKKFFLHGFGSAYGGQKWSDIIEHAQLFAQGKMNSEMFLDRSLSLEHNGGNMFNKNFIFSNYDNSIDLEIYTPTGISQSVYLPWTQFLFNLQNSSSVLIFHHIPALTAISQGKYDSYIKNHVQEHIDQLIAQGNQQHQLKDSSCASKQVNHIKEIARNLAETLNSLQKDNKTFVNKVQLDTPVNFNLANVYLSYYKSKGQEHREKIILENSSSINLFNDILYHVDNELKFGKNTTHKIDNKKSIPTDFTPVFQIHNLNHPEAKKLTRNDIGGKASGLVEMIHSGLNVPKALVFDTQTCLSYLQDKKHFTKSFKACVPHFNDYLKDEDGSPILVSVRSGAPISMPGMMDSILNVGIDDKTYPALVEKYGKTVIHECVINFMKQFCSSRLGLEVHFPKTLNLALDKFTHILIKNDIPCERRNLFPLSVDKQIEFSVEAVFDSWNSPRAVAWRQEKHIDHNMGTAATIQKMVFGNRNEKSLTCVIFSRDCITGKPEMMGEYLIKAQGDDLVSGRRTPVNIQDLKHVNPAVFEQIEAISKKLEQKHKAIQDIEITVENNEVFVLQKRNAVVSPDAQIALAKEMNLKLIDHVQLPQVMGTLTVETQEKPQFTGLSANPGIISGVVVKSETDVKKYASLNKPLVFMADQALPEHAPIMIATEAFITQSGGATSHAAILARSMNKPCVVGLGKMNFQAGQTVTIDAYSGSVWKGEQPIVQKQEQAKQLAEAILEEKKVVWNNCSDNKTNKNNGDSGFHKIALNSWITSLSQNKILDEKSKFKSFISLSQQAAAVVLKEHNKKKVKV